MEFDAERWVVDPLLESPADGAVERLAGQLAVPPHLFESCTGVLVTSDRHDRAAFSSLLALPSHLPVFLPESAEAVASALELRDRQVHRWRPGMALGGSIQCLSAGGGVLLTGQSKRLWLAPECPSEELVAQARAAGPLDVVVAPIQPELTGPLANSLGSDFPFERYQRHLRALVDSRARAIVGWASDLRFQAEWMNARAFCVTAARFAHDLSAMGSSSTIVDLAPGDGLLLHSLDVQRRLVKTVSRFAPLPEWEPDLGIPPVADANPRRTPITSLQRDVGEFVNRKLLARIGKLDAVWRERLERTHATWSLEIVFPDGNRLVRFLRFGPGRLAWIAEPPVVHLRSIVTASALFAALEGALGPFEVSLSIRKVASLYSVHPGGLRGESALGDDPLERVLVDGLAERHLAFTSSRVVQRRSA